MPGNVQGAVRPPPLAGRGLTRALLGLWIQNGWSQAVCISYTSESFRLFHASNLYVLNYRLCLLMYPGSETDPVRSSAPAPCDGGGRTLALAPHRDPEVSDPLVTRGFAVHTGPVQPEVGWD